MKPSSTPSDRTPGWHPDPSGRGQRYWDGHQWRGMIRTTAAQRRASGGGAWVRLSGSTSSTPGY
ncbi:MAG TPA: DUF2510 domain-containing protein [Thermoleophilaceae bacterium]|nr:DUF2510 domain-containing protein [Thermoleophilaceae bacterium]